MHGRIWAGYGRFPALAAALWCLLSCRVFEYSPYAVPRKDRGAPWLAGQLAKVASTEGPERDYSFAVIADLQSAYDELGDAVRTLNADSSIRFVIVAGDLTNLGLLQEFEWVSEILDGLRMPYLPVIGNHDCQANGVDIYERFWGPLDYTFSYRQSTFIIFNDNDWEFADTVPDTVRLASELESAPDSSRLFTVSHIPPWGDQISAPLGKAMIGLFARHGVTLSIHGHQHNFHFEPHDQERMPYVTVDNIADRNFVKVSLQDSGMVVKRVFF